MKNFLNISDTSIQDLKGILEQAKTMKTARIGLPKGACDEGRPLSQHVVALVLRPLAWQFLKPYCVASSVWPSKSHESDSNRSTSIVFAVGGSGSAWQ